MRKEVEIVIAIGTNTNQEISMFLAKQLLEQLLKGIKFTEELWTLPVDIKSDRFLNCLAIGHTTHGAPQIKNALRRIENRCGDSKTARANGSVKMDIDILLYDGQRMHEKDWERPYIQTLMKEVETIRNNETSNTKE
ncbi:MAG: 2-amino-4-hydroxy-6-hydroxymethyldihydropteridine diphosphokinase [Prevotella sp.]|nr:2-amino-4-hydroxy-6-hydroxymethyldihydropteridine diphosphokinase [Prevotella sp.]